MIIQRINIVTVKIRHWHARLHSAQWHQSHMLQQTWRLLACIWRKVRVGKLSGPQTDSTAHCWEIEWHTGRLPYCVYLLSINTHSLVSCGVASVNSTYWSGRGVDHLVYDEWRDQKDSFWYSLIVHSSCEAHAATVCECIPAQVYAASSSHSRNS